MSSDDAKSNPNFDEHRELRDDVFRTPPYACSGCLGAMAYAGISFAFLFYLSFYSSVLFSSAIFFFFGLWSAFYDFALIDTRLGIVGS